jgi:hypothetical protein
MPSKEREKDCRPTYLTNENPPELKLPKERG